MPEEFEIAEENTSPVVELVTVPSSTAEDKSEVLPSIQWNALPNEIKLHIFSFLSPDDLLKMQGVSQADCGLAKDEGLWNQKIRNFPADTQNLVYQNKQKTFFALRNDTFKNMQKRQVVILQAIIDEDITTLSKHELKHADLGIADKKNKKIKTYLIECKSLSIKTWAYQTLKSGYSNSPFDKTHLLEAAIFLRQPNEELDLIIGDCVSEWIAVSFCTEYGYLEILKRLVTGRPDLINDKAYSTKPSSLLMLAVVQGNVEIVNFLLSQGANVNELNNHQESALHLAVMSNNVSCVAALMGQPNIACYADKNGETPVHIAARLGHLECIKLLLNTEPLVLENSTHLESIPMKKESLFKQEQEQSRKLEEARIKRNVQLKLFISFISLKNSEGKNSLTLAASRGFTEIVKHCLDIYLLWLNSLNLVEKLEYEFNLKANPDSHIFQIEEKVNPLFQAIEKGHNATAALLIEAKMPIDLQETQCAIHLAAKSGNLPIVQCLLERSKSQLNIQDSHQQTPLIHAAKQGHVELVRYLLKKKADLTVATVIPPQPFNRLGHDCTALHWAAAGGFITVVELLVLAGARETPLMRRNKFSISIFLAKAGKLEAIRVLAQTNPAALNDTDSFNRSVLMYAAKNGHLELVKYLLSQGVDTHQLTNRRKSCIDFALAKGHEAIVFEFIRQGVIVTTCLDKVNGLLNLVQGAGIETVKKNELIKNLCFYVLENNLSVGKAIHNLVSENNFSATEILYLLIRMYPHTWLDLQDSAGEALVFKLIRCTEISANFLKTHLKDIDINRVDEENKSLIYHAIASQNDTAVSFLLNKKPNLQTLPSPLHGLLDQAATRVSTLNRFINYDPTLVAFRDEDGVSILDRVVTQDKFADCVYDFCQNVPNTQAGDNIKRQALLSALLAKKWDNAGKLMYMGATFDPKWYLDSDLNIPNQEQLKLFLYITTRRLQGPYKTYLSFFGCKIMGLGYSREEKLDAAEALRDVCLNEGSEDRLGYHQDALNNGELGEIYKNLMQLR